MEDIENPFEELVREEEFYDNITNIPYKFYDDIEKIIGVYTGSIDYFVENLRLYCGQRDLNEDFVTELRDGIKRTNTILGSIILIADTRRKYLRLIDGQHRIEALRTLVKDREVFNRLNTNLSFTIYKIDGKTEEEVIKLMDDLNIRHKYNHTEDSRNPKTLKMVRILSEKLRNTSKTGENAFKTPVYGHNIQKPYINERDFISFFDKIIKKYGKFSDEEFAEKIVNFNSQLYEVSQTDFLQKYDYYLSNNGIGAGKQKTTRQVKTQMTKYNKAKELNCLFGMFYLKDQKFWIENLNLE